MDPSKKQASKFYSKAVDIMRHKKASGYLLIVALLLAFPAQAGGTTDLYITKYASDGITILEETNVSWEWMMENLPIHGDGATHYYYQGPIFKEAWKKEHPNAPYDRWNPEEDMNVLGKDMGKVMGSSVKDLCDLVGGMKPGDLAVIKAADGFQKTIPYANVYEPDPRQGVMIVSWYAIGLSSGGDGGYVPDDYREGMRLIFLADDSSNPWGKHVFGIEDMRRCLPEQFWHYYSYPDYPSTTGYSVKYVESIEIYSKEPPR